MQVQPMSFNLQASDIHAVIFAICVKKEVDMKKAQNAGYENSQKRLGKKLSFTIEKQMFLHSRFKNLQKMPRHTQFCRYSNGLSKEYATATDRYITKNTIKVNFELTISAYII